MEAPLENYGLNIKHRLLFCEVSRGVNMNHFFSDSNSLILVRLKLIHCFPERITV